MMRLTPAQRALLHRVDRLVPFDEPGTSVRPIKALAALGLVTYEPVKRYVKTRGYPDRVQVMYRVTLTKKGSDFIYNGGIDH